MKRQGGKRGERRSEKTLNATEWLIDEWEEEGENEVKRLGENLNATELISDEWEEEGEYEPKRLGEILIVTRYENNCFELSYSIFLMPGGAK